MIPLDPDVVESYHAELDAIEAELARRELPSFIFKTWRFVEPKEPLSWNWHLDEMCRLLMAITANDRTVVPEDDIIFNVPPGTMKSLLVSVFWPAWEWASEPSLRYLCGAYGSDISIRDNLRLRAVVTSPWYQAHFSDVILKEDQNAKERYNTTAGGWRVATSPEGVGTGEHPDRIILDDLLTEAQSRSAKERERVNNWIDRTISTRGISRAIRKVMVMQRLHRDDPTGHVMKKSGWMQVIFPMRYVPAKKPNTVTGDPGYRPDPHDRRRQPGELLWPSLLPEDKVRKVELRLGPYGTAGQMQQQPAPEGGGLFRRSWFKFVEVAPKTARRVRCWDTAASEDTGDFTAGCRLAESDGRVFIEHMARGQWSPAEVETNMHAYAASDGVSVPIRELKEPAAAGKTVIAVRTVSLKGFDHAGVTVSQDKVMMARPLRAQVEAGNVFIVRTGDPVVDAWIEPFLTELADFPTGDNDDQVDAVANAYNQVLLLPKPQTSATWGRG